jgi:hypothetical protein
VHCPNSAPFKVRVTRSRPFGTRLRGKGGRDGATLLAGPDRPSFEQRRFVLLFFVRVNASFLSISIFPEAVLEEGDSVRPGV